MFGVLRITNNEVRILKKECMEIKVLGTGCAKCKALEKAVLEAVERCGVEAQVSKVEDIVEIMEFNVMSTPALVVNNKVVATGKVLSANEIVKMLTQ